MRRAGYLPRTELEERVDAKRVPIASTDKGLDRLPENIVRDPDHGRALDQPTLEQHLFDLGGADSKTRRLDHGVAATHEIEEAIRVHRHVVAGIANQLTLAYLRLA